MYLYVYYTYVYIYIYIHTYTYIHIISLSPHSLKSIDGSVGWFTLLPPEGLEFDPGPGHN